LLAVYFGFWRSRTKDGTLPREPSASPRFPGVLFGEAIRRNQKRALPARFEQMEAAEFEAEVADLLRAQGFAVRTTPSSRTHDVDLILETTGRKVAVQLKRWNAPVGDRSVYALFTGRVRHGTDEAWLITTSRFTTKAARLARTTGVRLVSGAELAGWLEDGRERGDGGEP
jgi:HJR/Mrr/RecB family endonuclease